MRVRRSDRYIEELYPNVWLMDNHKWAFYAWESHRVRPGNEIPSVLVHVDYHWDGVNDFQEPAAVTHLINLHSCENIKELVAEDTLVRYDSFIAPAIIRGFIREIHFFCLDHENDVGLDKSLLHEYRATQATQFIHTDIDSLIEHVAGRLLIFDFDIDIFNRSDRWNEGNIWAERDIIDFVDKCSKLIMRSSVVTIAMSFDYSGTDDDTAHIVKLVAPRIIKHFQRRSS